MTLWNTKKLKYFISHASKNPNEHCCIVTFQVSNSCPPDKGRIKTKMNMENW